MATEHQGVAADLPDVLLEQFLGWKTERGYATDSQALIALLELFFSSSLARPSTSLPTGSDPHSPIDPDLIQIQAQLTHLQAASEWLELGQVQLKQEIISQQPFVKEARIHKLEQEVAQLKEVIQMGRGLINDRMELLQARILQLEGRSQSAPGDAVNFDDLPDDEPDEILTDFLEPESD